MSTTLSSPAMRVGLASRVLVSPGPRISPQQKTAPLTSAQALPSPAATCEAPVTPAIRAGVGETGRFSSGLAAPFWFEPQHQTAPALSSAQVCESVDDCETAIWAISGNPTGL